MLSFTAALWCVHMKCGHVYSVMLLWVHRSYLHIYGAISSCVNVLYLQANPSNDFSFTYGIISSLGWKKFFDMYCTVCRAFRGKLLRYQERTVFFENGVYFIITQNNSDCVVSRDRKSINLSLP